MKSNFKMKLLCSTLALSILLTACGGSNNNGTENMGGTEVGGIVEDTQDVTVQEDESEFVTGAPETETEILTDEEKEWQNYLMADVDVCLRIRKGPSVETDIVGVLERGARATIIEKGEEWTKISSGGVEGYVSNKYCLYGLDALDFAKDVCKTLATSTTDLLNIRQGMSTESEVLAKFSKDAKLAVDTDAEIEEGWVAVRFNGLTAYVSAEYVTLALDIKTAITIEEVYAREKEAYDKAQAQAQKPQQNPSTSTKPNTNTSTGSGSVSGGTYTTINSPVIMNASEFEVLAAMIWCESGNQSYECNLAVASVIMNRVKSEIFPNTVKTVVFADGQFPPATDGILENCLKYGKTTENCYKAAQAVLNGEDNTDGCLYFNTYNGTREGLRIGAMVFWKKWK